MRPYKIELAGYKRFKEVSAMNVSGKLTAIVGPNEAGKTSFLEAVERLGRDDPFDSHEHTRQFAGETYVRGFFKLEDADRDALQDLPGGSSVSDYEFTRRSDGRRVTKITPRLRRDLDPRHSLGVELSRVTTTNWYERLDFQDNEETGESGEELVAAFKALVERAIAILASDDESLTDEQIQELELIENRLTASAGAKSYENAVSKLEGLLELERADAPEVEAKRRLAVRVPEFLLFDTDSLNIPDSHAMGTDLPQGLKNLCELAEFDYDEAFEAEQSGESGRRDGLVTRANAKLEEFFASSWGQSKIAVRLAVDSPDGEPRLTVQAWDEEYEYHELSLRSQGLRQFVALVAFIEIRAQRSSAPKILLIDEAEQHLHYDAQADLVRVLTTQPVAQKVIYTTHSAGCLPADLGTGVRLIAKDGPEGTPDDEWRESKVHNWFWTASGVGFSPLLIGMGAASFAFAATRYALMTEGPTDMMLLPSLFCEADEREYLLFQCVPGLSTEPTKSAEHFELTAAQVAYLVDGDPAGSRMKRDLVEEAGAPDARVFDLLNGEEELETEDLVDPEVFLKAVNLVVQDTCKCGPIPADAIPEAGRPAAINAWLSSNGEEPLPKRMVAERILDLRDDGPILSERRAAFVREKLLAIEQALGIGSSGS